MALEQRYIARKLQDNFVRKIQKLRFRRLNKEIKQKYCDVETFYQMLEALTEEVYMEIFKFTKFTHGL